MFTMFIDNIEKFNLVRGHWRGFFEEAGENGRMGSLNYDCILVKPVQIEEEA